MEHVAENTTTVKLAVGKALEYVRALPICDAFGGGFVSGLCKNYDPLDGVLHGNVSASLMLEGSGAFHPLDVMPGLVGARLNALRDMVRKV